MNYFIKKSQIRVFSLAVILATFLSGCKKESVEPDNIKDDKPALLTDIQKIEGGGFHTMLLKTDSTLWATGENDKGQLGTGDLASRHAFEKVLTDVVNVACGFEHTLALKSDGSLWVTGCNEDGQLGNGKNSNLYSFKKVLENIKSIDAGSRHSMALNKNNILFVTGCNKYGQLGINNDDNCNTFIGVKEVRSIAAGGNHSFIIDENNDLWATGNNNYGQLGSFDFEDQIAFKKVMSGIAKVSGGLSYSMAFSKEGDLYVSGAANFEFSMRESVFSEYTGFSVNEFTSGLYHHLVVSDSSLWSINFNDSHHLGNDNNDPKTFKLIVEGNVSRAFAGSGNTFYIDTQGKLWAMGCNEKGQLGTGSIETVNQFKKIEF